MALTDTDRKLPSVGEQAPDFTLPSHNEGKLNLAWYRGRKNVVLAFYPGDWTPVCTVQLPGYVPLMDTFDKYEVQILGVSVDSIPCHIAWAKSEGGLPFPLMSDYYPHGQVSAKYGVLSEKGYALRAVFVIDKKGIIRFVQTPPLSEVPDNDALIEALKKIQNGKG